MSLTNNPAANFDLSNFKEDSLREHIEAIRSYIVAAPNQQAAYLAAQALGSLISGLNATAA